jgi:hypothetical protein
VNSIQAATAEAFESWEGAFIVTGGDMNYPAGAAATLNASHAAFASWKTDELWYPAVGKMEWEEPRADPFVLNFTYLPGNRRYYKKYFPYLGLELFFISTDDDEMDGVTGGSLQQQWLRENLLNSNARYRIIVGNMATVSTVDDAVADDKVATYLSWIHQMPKAHAYFHGGTGTAQHNIVTEEGVLKMHLLDVSASSNSLAAISSGATLQGVTEDVQNVWNYAEETLTGPACVAKVTLGKDVATVTVHNALTQETLHTFNLFPY